MSVRSAVIVVVLVLVLAAAASGCGSARAPARHLVPTAAGSTQSQSYRASLAFARCMRAHGIPHPNPDRLGNFSLTPRQEREMRRAASPKRHEQVERACFHYLKPVVSTKPLLAHARSLARGALRTFAGCMAARGYDFFRSRPVVRNLTLGRAFFGFAEVDPRSRRVQNAPAFLRARAACEKRLNARLDAIIAADRIETRY